MHGPDEFAVVDELLMSAKIFAQVIVDLWQLTGRHMIM